MPGPIDILLAVIVPSALALVVLAVSRGLGGASAGAWTCRGAALAVAGAFVAAYVARRGWPQVAPHEAQGFLPHGALAGALAALVLSLSRVPGWARWLAAAASAVAAAWLLLRFRFSIPAEFGGWSGVGGAGLVALHALGILALWALLEPLAAGDDSPALPLALAAAAGLAGPVLGFRGSQDFSLIAAALSGALAGAALVAWWFGGSSLRRGAVLVFAVAHGGLLIGAAHLTELEPYAAATLAATPLLAWVAMVPPLRSMRPPVRALLTSAVVAAPALAVLIPAALRFFATPDAADYGY